MPIETETMEESDLRDLTKLLLLDRLVTSYQALIDASGEEEAIRALAPYIRHGGMAMASNIKARMGWPDSMETIAKVMNYADDCLSGGQSTFEQWENGLVGETKECVMGESMGFCQSALGSSLEGACEATDPSCEMVMLHFFTRDEPYCRTLIRKKQSSDPSKFNLGRRIRTMEKLEVSPEEMYSIQCQFLGEWWNLVTKAFVDLHGERTIGLLAPYMRHSGMSAAILMAKRFKLQNNDLDAITVMVDFYGKAMGQIGETKCDSKRSEKTITECPFSDSPIEICQQLEQIANGICEAINPNYEFVYDRMMSNGDESCHWRIRKKGEGQRKAQICVARAEDDPLRVLKLRFVKGEITKEEFEEMAELLNKY